MFVNFRVIHYTAIDQKYRLELTSWAYHLLCSTEITVYQWPPHLLSKLRMDLSKWTQYHYILPVMFHWPKQVTWSSPDLKEGEMNATSWWEKLQSHIAKSTHAGVRGIYDHLIKSTTSGGLSLCQKAQKLSETNGGISKGHRRQYKGASTAYNGATGISEILQEKQSWDMNRWSKMSRMLRMIETVMDTQTFILVVSLLLVYLNFH